MNSAPIDTHICIVSSQPIPNIIAALDPACDARNIVLLATRQMCAQAGNLRAVFERHGLMLEIREIPGHEDLDALQKHLLDVLAVHPGTALNATGGTKPMSLTAFEVFRQAERPVFYVERDNTLLWLSPKPYPPRRIPGVLDIDDYFAAFGKEIAASQRAPLDSDGGLKALGRPSQLPRSGKGEFGPKFESLVFRAMRAAINDVDAQGICDIRWAVRIKGNPGDEFDVVVCLDNRLYLVEAKNTSKTDSLNNFLHKIDNLRKSHGLTARAALVTTANINAQGGYSRRARDNRILLIGKNQLSQLTRHFSKWLLDAD